MNNDKIGKFILKKRLEKGLTQNELGKKLYVTGKAVSKWERGLSLPDITILEKLSEILDTDIYEVLQIKKSENIIIEEKLKEEKIKIKKNIRKKTCILFIIIIIFFSIILFKLLPFGYDVAHVRYTHDVNKLINIGKPKFSFYLKNNEDSYLYKSLRGEKVLTSEIKSYLNTLEHISCNDTLYYYDKDADITIVDYSVENHFLYNNISYHVRDGNYCNTLELEEYKEKLGGLVKTFTIYAEDTDLYIYFSVGVLKENGKNKFVATLSIYYYGEENGATIIEESSGTFEIVDNELHYYREQINKSAANIKIPNISEFVIKKQKLILKENYLSNYKQGIILK